MKICLALATLFSTLVLLPSSASAATCSDYPNQAAAQRAADTRDADGDGIYCESLPCPCATGGGGNGGGGGSSSKPRKPKVSLSERRRQKVEKRTWRITSVVDGDTLKVKRTDAPVYERVRLIGVDTPEVNGATECGGEEASASMTARAFPDGSDRGRRVKLKTDRSGNLRDRYGRLLAYVITLAGDDLGRKQVEFGWSTAYRYQGRSFERYRSYRKARSVARSNKRGVWKMCGGNFHQAL